MFTTRLFRLSATQYVPLGPTATWYGRENAVVDTPVVGLMLFTKAPACVKMSIRLFSLSITTTSPFGAIVTPRGKIIEPLGEP